MGTIVAIGGIKKEIQDIKNICGEIIRLVKEDRPRLLYIPTANNDHKQYSMLMKKFFEENYQCKVDVLWLLRRENSILEIENKIKTADIIFVEGGNLIKLLKIWRKYKIDDKLVEAYKKGVILSGISAGANCWFEYSYSDSVERKKFDFVKGIGIVKGCICPHYNDEERKKSFENQINKRKYISNVYTIEDNNAIVIKETEIIELSEKDNKLIKRYIVNE